MRPRELRARFIDISDGILKPAEVERLDVKDRIASAVDLTTPQQYIAAGFDVMGPAGTLYMSGMEGGIPVAAPVDDAGARDAGAAVAEDRAVPRPAE